MLLRAKEKILLLVSIQILVIFASFSLVTYYEEEKRDASVQVNIAGKNRFLTLSIDHEFNKFSRSGSDSSGIYNAIKDLENNIKLLQYGGSFIDLEVGPLPKDFEGDLTELNFRVNEMKQTFEGLIEKRMDGPLDNLVFFEHEVPVEDVLRESNELTNDLSRYYNEISGILLSIQYTLAPINIIIYIVTIFVILKILKKESEEKTKLHKMAAVGQIYSKVAHDLRNPLIVIKNSAELIKNDKSAEPEKTLNRIDLILKSVKRMNQQVDDIMNYIRNRPLKISKKPIKEIISSALQTTEIPHTISIKLPTNDIELECDPGKLENLFSNLFVNSIQAIGENKGEIAIILKHTDNDFVEITIQDSGPGIPDELLGNIFEPLFTTKSMGTGLGLVSCKNIVEQHKGTIEVFNNPTRFVIKLPIHQK